MPVASRSQSHDSTDRFRCTICQDLLIEPVSITCGHTFCRLCLAKWTLHCKETRCVLCQQFWTGQPQVNIVLRETIQELFPDAYDVRAVNHNREAAVVDYFDSFIRQMLDERQQLIQQNQNQAVANQDNTNVGFFTLKIIYVVLAIAVSLVSVRSTETYVVKPVVSWTLMDSMHWLDNLGDWTKKNLVPTFATHHLDGQGLLAVINHTSTLTIQEFLSKESVEHQQLLQKVLNYVSIKGKVPPGDFWEFKDVYPTAALGILQLVLAFPRLAPLVMICIDYKGTFLPLIHITAGNLNISIYDTELPTPSLSQYLNFVARLTFFPFLTVYTKFLYVAVWPTNPWVAFWAGWMLLLRTMLDINLYAVIIMRDSLRMEILGCMCSTLKILKWQFIVLCLAGLILPKVLYMLVCSTLFYIDFLAQPLQDTVIVARLLFGFIRYIQQHSRDELLNEARAIWTSLVLNFWRNAQGHCWQFATVIHQMMKAFMDGTIHYITQSALGDLRSLMQSFYNGVISMARFVAHFAIRQMGHNEQ